VRLISAAIESYAWKPIRKKEIIKKERKKKDKGM
jgi:hypothetical protein